MDDDAQSGVHAVTMADIPFEAIREHWHSLPTWPPHMAAAWAAQPTWEEVVAQAKKQTGGPGMREASEAVLAALIDGRLVAYGVPVKKAENWTPLDDQPHEEITPDEWRRLVWIGGTLSAPAYHKGNGEKIYLDVQIDRIGLFALWPDRHLADLIEIEISEDKNIAPDIRVTHNELMQFWNVLRQQQAAPNSFEPTRQDLLNAAKAHFAPRLVTDSGPFRSAVLECGYRRGTGKHGSQKKSKPV